MLANFRRLLRDAPPLSVSSPLAAVTLALGIVLVSLGLVASDPVEANRIAIPINIVATLPAAQISTPSQPSPPAVEAEVEQTRLLTAEVRRGDNLSLIFGRTGLTRSDLQLVLESDRATRSLLDIFPGQSFQFRVDNAGALLEMRFVKTALETGVFRRTGERFEFTSEVQTPEVRQAFRHGTISDSLFSAGIAAGLSNRMILELANVFGGVIDFALDPRVGDTFSLLYEEHYLHGEKIGEGAIIGAHYTNDGKIFSAFRFTDSQGQTGYFSADGVSMRKAFLRSPLDITRVSSNFNLRRLHPIARVIRPHRGVDYAASTGTPVYSSGDGRVVASGYSRGNGNFVFIQHGDTITTRYLHLHKRLVKNGDRVKQGQTIGTVGATGLATGPHLHYEFLVDGVHRNPRTVLDNLPRARALDSREMATFLPQAETLQEQLASYTTAWELAVASTAE